MGHVRNSRDRRRASGKISLTLRDEATLRVLNRFRLARSSDLRRVVFADRSPGRVAERLRQLFHAGFVDVHLGRLSEENVYSLGPAGRRWAETAIGKVGKIPAGGRMHHLAIVGAWTRLAEATRKTEGVTLRRFRPDWELRELQLSLQVVPDALVELERGEGIIRFALEVDLATERHAVLHRKFEGYRRLRWAAREAWGWDDLRVVVLILAGGARRTTSLRQLVGKTEASGIEVVERELWPAGALALTPHTAPVNGKRGLETVSGSGEASPPGGEAGLSPKESAGSVGS